MWNAKLIDSVAMMEDGRYTRRMVVAQIIWNPCTDNGRGSK